jgi:hypothetical protein
MGMAWAWHGQAVGIAWEVAWEHQPKSAHCMGVIHAHVVVVSRLWLQLLWDFLGLRWFFWWCCGGSGVDWESHGLPMKFS